MSIWHCHEHRLTEVLFLLLRMENCRYITKIQFRKWRCYFFELIIVIIITKNDIIEPIFFLTNAGGDSWIKKLGIFFQNMPFMWFFSFCVCFLKFFTLRSLVFIGMIGVNYSSIQNSGMAHFGNIILTTDRWVHG